MNELIQVGKNTYYLDWPSKVGIYRINEQDVYLIDSGNDQEAGKKILKVLEDNNWHLVAIINTHSHADHIGGNNYLQEKTNCLIYSSLLEKEVIENPIFEPTTLYGGYPSNQLRNKFLMASPSRCNSVDELITDKIEVISLKGHSANMIGIKTDDDIIFLGDAILDENIINKYHVFYLYDIKEYLKTLDIINNMNAKLFIPSHTKVTVELSNLVILNKDKINEISNKILSICSIPTSFENILKEIFTTYNLKMNFMQYVLVGSTIKSYLSYLLDNNKMVFEFINSEMMWKTVISGVL